MQHALHNARFAVGTMMSKGEASLHLCSFNAINGTISIVDSLDAIASPTFAVAHPGLPVLYAVSETARTDTVEQGSVVAVPLKKDYSAFDASAAVLSPVLSGGTNPCHLHVDREGTTLFVSNYGNGVCSVIPIDSSGRLSEYIQRFSFEGKGLREDRQECSHIHSSLLCPDERFLFVADLGLDHIVRYDCTRPHKRGPIVLANQHIINVRGGSGPRHMHFSPDGRFLYVVQELSNEISVFTYEGETGTVHLIQTVTTLPEQRSKVLHKAADIHLSQDGRFLYCSNRGHESIACFVRDEHTGMLSIIDYCNSGGAHPRNFALDASGLWMLIANADTDDITVCAVNTSTGLISSPVSRIAIGKPVCITWL